MGKTIKKTNSCYSNFKRSFEGRRRRLSLLNTQEIRMPTIKNYVSTIGGICGAESDIIVTLKSEEMDIAITSIIKRSKIKKSVSGFMFELQFHDVTFRLFSSGRVVFRGIKNRKELNRLLAALLL
jgi:hypothetical protein